MKNIIVGTGETQRLVIREARLEECERLQQLCDTWVDAKRVTGHAVEPDYVYTCLTEGDLPPVPGASQERFQFAGIYEKASGEPVGVIELYHGYPTDETVWIGLLLIEEKYRHLGYGQEAVEYLSEAARAAQYPQISLGVHLKNWPALRFWTQAGFNRIERVVGDKEYGADTFAIMAVTKDLA